MALSLNVWKRVSDLDEKTTVADEDVFATDNPTETASTKISFKSLVAQIKTKLGLETIESNVSTLQSTVTNQALDITSIKEVNETQDETITGIQSNLTAETGRAQEAETALQEAITAEATRATGAEETLQGSVETIQTSIESLTTNLTEEIARAKTAESTLETSINEIKPKVLTYQYIGTDGFIHTHYEKEV